MPLIGNKATVCQTIAIAVTMALAFSREVELGRSGRGLFKKSVARMRKASSRMVKISVLQMKSRLWTCVLADSWKGGQYMS